MTNDEKWEVLRVNIESLHSNVHQLWEASQRHDAAISRISDLMEKNEERMEKNEERMAALIENSIRLNNIVIAHDEQLHDHGRRLKDLEG